uniref:Uncharacterized protein n=1 Tax=Anthurium amnicola TaxID=1678845 RepID=A0A1D1XM98_9ARAE
MLRVSPPDGGFDGGVSKMYGAAKRRRVSANRRFPMGCGRNASFASVEDHLPRLPAAAAANNGSLESSKERMRPSMHLDRHGAPVTGGTSEVQNGKTVEHGAEEPRDAAIVGNLVTNKELDESKSTSGSEIKLDKAEHDLDEQELSVLTNDRIFHSGFSKLYGAATRRKASAVRSFPVGCGRNTALMSKEESLEFAAAAAANSRKSGAPSEDAVLRKKARTVTKELDAMKDGNSDMELGLAEERLSRFGNHVKKEPKEEKDEDLEMELQKAGEALGMQDMQASTKMKKFPAIRHFPVGSGRIADEISERSRGTQAQEQKVCGEDKAKSISKSASNGSVTVSPSLSQLVRRTKIPSQSKGRTAEKEGRASTGKSVKMNGLDIEGRDRGLSEDPKEVRVKIIVQVLMAPSKCPWSRGKHLAK